jgi:hypothetical protein
MLRTRLHSFATSDSPEVCPKGYSTPDHSNSHNVAVVVDDFREAKYVKVVKDRGSDECEVGREERVTVILKGFVSGRWLRQALLHMTWHDPRKEELEKNEAGIHLPCVEVRAGVLHEGRWMR